MANNVQYKLDNRLPAVNSNEYWMFRKQHPAPNTKGITHAKFIVPFIAEQMIKAKIERTAENIWGFIRKTLDNKETANLSAGSQNRQLLQYLGQLDDKGISAVINKISIWSAE